MSFDDAAQTASFAAASRAESRWRQVYAENLPRIYNFFRYRLGDHPEVEDLTARTFEKAWRARDKYREDLAGFSTWLLAIARNLAVDHLRSLKRHAPLDVAEHVAVEGTPEESEIQRSDFSRLAVLTARLPAREQELIALKYGAGCTNRTIAQLTGISESNVGTILHRVVQQLRTDW